MRTLPAVLVVSLLVLGVSACSDTSVSPTQPLRTAPLVYSHVGSSFGDPTTSDLCGGLSPCDAYDYDRNLDGTPDGIVGVPGFCFIPPMVDNHLSDPACSGAFVPGLNGIFQLAWCQVQYPGTYPALDGTVAPTIVSCQDPSQWQDLVQDTSGGEFYTASVQWKKHDAAVGTVFRLYVVHKDIHFAHRDVVIDPNLTTPSDDFVHAIKYGKEPVKVRITRGFSCVKYDTQEAGTDNAATCLVDGASSFSFETAKVTATFDFPDGNPAALFQFELSECLSLGFDNVDGMITGNALVDTPLADCKLSMNSDEIQTLTVPAQLTITVNDARWDTLSADNAPFRKARLNLLQYDELGVAVVPPTTTPSPNWFETAASGATALRWIGKGLDRLASLLLPESLYAGQTTYPPPNNTFSLYSTTDYQVSLQFVETPDVPGNPCDPPSPSCTDLGTFSGSSPVDVSVKASAPDNTGPHAYPDGYFPVPYARLHFFPETGTVACPVDSIGPLDTLGRGCYPAHVPDESTKPASDWDHLVYVTGFNGAAPVKWSLASGDNTLHVSACGGGRAGTHEPSLVNGDWGILGDCSDRRSAMTDPNGYDNGAAMGLSPFEPLDTVHLAAISGLPLTFKAHTCPQITIDGLEGTVNGGSEWACADSVGFSAPLSGPKGAINAWFYTYNDADAVYVALKVNTDNLGNKIFLNFVENTNDLQVAGDELLDLDFSGTGVPLDWHFTQSCVDNNSASLCGDTDALPDGTAYDASAAAQVNGAGSGWVFYEFRRPLNSPNNGTTSAAKEDLHATTGQTIGVRATVTQGSGGGRGGFVFPDYPKNSPVEFYQFTIK